MMSSVFAILGLTFINIVYGLLMGNWTVSGIGSIVIVLVLYLDDIKQETILAIKQKDK